MISIETNSVADLFFQLRWSSGEIVHADAYAGRQVNFWRDLLPPRLTEQLWGKKPGDRVTIEFTPGELFNGSQGKDVRRLSRDQFDPERIGAPDLPPRVGRFYPKGLLKDVAGIFRENIVPFRCVGIDNRHLVVDLGHPLAENPLSLSVTVGTVSSKQTSAAAACGLDRDHDPGDRHAGTVARAGYRFFQTLPHSTVRMRRPIRHSTKNRAWCNIWTKLPGFGAGPVW
jgi:FKBP-type peptidyl-prolyl cis-trans isomerase 2